MAAAEVDGGAKAQQDVSARSSARKGNAQFNVFKRKRPSKRNQGELLEEMNHMGSTGKTSEEGNINTGQPSEKNAVNVEYEGEVPGEDGFQASQNYLDARVMA